MRWNEFIEKNRDNILTTFIGGYLGFVILSWFSHPEILKMVILLPILALGAVWLTWLISKKPIYGVYLIAFFLPFERTFSTELFGMTLRIHQIIALVLMNVVFIKKALSGKIIFKPSPIIIPLYLYFSFALLSGAFAIYPAISIKNIVFLLFVVLSGYVIYDTIQSRKEVRNILALVIASALFSVMFGVFQFLGDNIGLSPAITQIRMDWYNKEVIGTTRVHAFSLEPLYFVNYLLISIPLAFALLIGRFRSKLIIFSRPILIIFLLFGALATLFSLSRGGYVAMAIALFVVSFLMFRHLIRPKTLLVGGGILVLIIGVFWSSIRDSGYISSDFIVGRATSILETEADRERFFGYEKAWEAFKLNPIVGIGPGNFGRYIRGNSNAEPQNGWWIVNNEYLEILSETGILGFLALSGAFFVWMFSLKKSLSSNDQLKRIIAIGGLATAVAFAFQYLTFSTLYVSHIWFYIWFTMAVQQLPGERTHE